jgi:hypothetical protein
MPIIQAVTSSFCQQLLQGLHDFSDTGGNNYRIALYGSSADLGPQTTAYTSTGEVSASGYTAGGASLTNLGVASAGTVGYTSFATVTWTSEINASGALIYGTDISGATNASVMVLSFGMNRGSVAGVFTITFPTNNSTSAILRINAPLA